MNKEHSLINDPRIQGAVEELRTLIAGRYPAASFAVFERDDPKGVRLRATVDIADTDEVMESVLDARPSGENHRLRLSCTAPDGAAFHPPGSVVPVSN